MWIGVITLLIVSYHSCAWDWNNNGTVPEVVKKVLNTLDLHNFNKHETLTYINQQRLGNFSRDGKNHKEEGNQCNSNGKQEKNDPSTRVPNLTKDEKVGPYQNISVVKPLRKKRHANITEKCPISRRSKTRRDKFQNIQDETDVKKFSQQEPRRKKRRRKKKRKKRRHWSKWSEWSSCSVTCGKGRRIRFRKCIAKLCPTGEIEMGEKTCQLPACSLLDKLFGFL